MEAGLEHLSKAGGTLRYVDLLLVVVEARAKALITADRMIALARELGISVVALVGNRVGPGDDEQLNAFARDHGCELLGLIPEDQTILLADRLGVCPLDLAPGSDAVRAIQDLGEALERLYLTSAVEPA